MVSTFTNSRSLENPAAGDQVGTWGTASINPNMVVLDSAIGGVTTINVSAGSYNFGAGDARNAMITLSSTLVGSITVTFLSSLYGQYIINNRATGSSAFIITMGTTAAGGEAICAPPGELVDIFNDGTNLRFRNLERVGTLVPTMYSSMPAWIDGCTRKPYLNCDGTTFSSAYAALQAVLGSTTLPDYRGRYTAALNQGTARIQSSVAGVDGDTRGASGGITRLTNSHLPDFSHNHSLTTAVSTDGFAYTDILRTSSEPHATWALNGESATGFDNTSSGLFAPNEARIFQSRQMAVALSTQGSTSPTGFVPPTAISGITMIRAG